MMMTFTMMTVAMTLLPTTRSMEHPEPLLVQKAIVIPAMIQVHVPVQPERSMPAAAEPPQVVLPVAHSPAVVAAEETDGVRAVLRSAGWPEHLVEDAATVAWCESRWRPDAVGDGGQSLGLFQLWRGWFSWAGHDIERWDDPNVNARVALLVAERDMALGRDPWTQWTCKP